MIMDSIWMSFCMLQKVSKRITFSFEKLDNALTKYYEMRLLSIMEIDSFEKEKKTFIRLLLKSTKQLESTTKTWKELSKTIS